MPYSTNGSDISASPGVSSDFQIDPSFSVSGGDIMCGAEYFTPIGYVSASITVPAGWGSTVDCTETCLTSDFINTSELIDASVTPPSGFGVAYSESVVVTLTWTP
jgi:hypothetical protein